MVHHMFLHALGFHHTQTRPDRDDFIDVNAEKVEELPGTLKKLNLIKNLIRNQNWTGIRKFYFQM